MHLLTQHRALLKDWRIVFANDLPRGSIPLSRHALAPQGIYSSVFCGASLWILDAAAHTQEYCDHFMLGTGHYLDSNVASYIRRISYARAPSVAARTACPQMAAVFPGRMVWNPYLYLWECKRYWQNHCRLPRSAGGDCRAGMGR